MSFILNMPLFIEQFLEIEIISYVIYLLKNYGDLYLYGAGVTLLLAIVGTFFGTLLGFILVLFKSITIHFKDPFIIRIFKKTISFLATTYIDIVRGTPMIVQATVFYYAFFVHYSDNKILAGIVIISLNTAAYIAEVFRSGILALGDNQIEAARSLGLSRFQAMRYVVFPQVLKNAVPSLSNELIVNVKDSSVLSTIGVVELFFSAKSAASQNYYNDATYLIAAVIYFIMTFILSRLLAHFISGKGRKTNISSQTVPEVA